MKTNHMKVVNKEFAFDYCNVIQKIIQDENSMVWLKNSGFLFGLFLCQKCAWIFIAINAYLYDAFFLSII